MNAGDIVGEWTIIKVLPSTKRPSGATRYIWLCECSCGLQKPVEQASLKHGRSTHCGHRRYRFGEDNPGWKGGTSIHKAGYVVVSGRKINGKLVGRDLEHRTVMEKKLGRKLFSCESVHHKNGIRSDNRPDNLELWAASGHPKGQRVQDLVDWAETVLLKYAPERLAL